ncbi:10305_t:CDS:2 [Rhizophagus irregularis]|nr:10305_t:CDS:2 [Rhizophagus irregularis]
MIYFLLALRSSERVDGSKAFTIGHQIDVRQIKNFAETNNTNQLKNYCSQFILESGGL